MIIWLASYPKSGNTWIRSFIISLLSENGVPSNYIFKVGEGRPNIVDAIKNGQVQLVINTPLVF